MYKDPALAYAKTLRFGPPPGEPHGIAIPGSEREGRTAVYRHFRAKNGLVQTIDPKITTVHELFEASSQKYPTNKCLGWRERDPGTGNWGPFVWMDYQTVNKRRKDFGAGLKHLHERAGISEARFPIGLWSTNRPEWQITDLAACSQACFTVSIYDTLGHTTTEFIINHAEITTVVSSLNHIPTLLSIKDKCPTLKILISMDPLDNGELPGFNKLSILKAWAKDKGVDVYYMRDVETLGQRSGRSCNPPSPSDIITINYTSGTTGSPKGVVLTHENAIAATSCGVSSIMFQGPNDVMLSYLPLAHIFARLGEHISLWSGAAIGYFHGNMLELVDDLKILRPTVFFSVPRLFQKFYSAFKAAALEAPGVKGTLSRHIVSTKLANIESTGSNKHVLYDKIWSQKLASAVGLERARGMVTGSAPIDPTVHQFLRIVFSNDFINGYGLTESYAIGIGQLAGDNTAGNCGPPCIAVECCLKDVPSMDYFTTDKPHPRGELLLRGYTRFREYYKSPEQTAGAILEDGWFATGDVCSVDELGRFTVIDRVKNILKLAQGEYVSPERIEMNLLSHMPILAQAYVHGDSLQSFLVGVFGVDKQHFAPYASKILHKSVLAEDTDAILAACRDRIVRKAVLKDMDKVIEQTKFKGFERVKNAHLLVEPFTIENDLLTPTLKLKRHPVAKAFRQEIDDMYKEALKEEGPARAKL